ncbi:MAG: 4Fe-4S dicluster domain-containing protein [Pseudomonadota bacterium]|nr:MAG: 4Fe-4S dicluster domain-containing protein [Pseudomonadota bacterium]
MFGYNHRHFMVARLSSGSDAILQEANKCVACGLCLPHCPTYKKTQNENESPRGRIALMRGLALGELDATRNLRAHLDLCLSCRACERICPSQVRYGALHDATLSTIAHTRTESSLLRYLFAAVTRPRALAMQLRLASLSGVRAAMSLPIVRRTRLGRLLAQLPNATAWREHEPSYPAPTPRGDVMLFLGCVTRAADSETLQSAIRVLNALGYNVHIPKNQGCCGGLHLHTGRMDEARNLCTMNVRAFDDSSEWPIISVASGCGATLHDYESLCDKKAGVPFARRIVDISAFLTNTQWPPNVRLRPWKARIAVHDPCSLKNVLRQAANPYRLLQRIPEVEVMALADNETCCGAAGSYFLAQPTMADALRADKLSSIRKTRPDIVASSNVGCAFYLAAGLRSADYPLEVVHPVTLIARQLALPE